METATIRTACYNKNCLVSDCWKEGEWRLDFSRSLSQADIVQWERLLNILEQMEITESNDRVSWVLEKKGTYTTRSMYRLLSDRGGGA